MLLFLAVLCLICGGLVLFCLFRDCFAVFFVYGFVWGLVCCTFVLLNFLSSFCCVLPCSCFAVFLFRYLGSFVCCSLCCRDIDSFVVLFWFGVFLLSSFLSLCCFGLLRYCVVVFLFLALFCVGL